MIDDVIRSTIWLGLDVCVMKVSCCLFGSAVSRDLRSFILNQNQPHSCSLKTAVLIGRCFIQFLFLCVFPGRTSSRSSSSSLHLHWTKLLLPGSSDDLKLSLDKWWTTAGLAGGTTDVTWITCYRYLQHGRRLFSWTGVTALLVDERVSPVCTVHIIFKMNIFLHDWTENKLMTQHF